MSDFNPLDRAKINVHRSSFDLSSKKLFTAKIGEILPCYWQIAIPGKGIVTGKQIGRAHV